MNFKAYPLQFYPILKERIWGGEKLKTFLHKPIVSNITGESWEISTVNNDVSVISNGEYLGKNLNQLLDLYPKEILGTQIYTKFGKQFPLLFKFLDAKLDLSIQVHPNDELAKRRHNSFGKTEMWYVMQADQDAKIIVGFKENSNQQDYIQNLENKTLLNILDTKTVKQGDVFFLETGTIHAIGAGTVIAEIQQTSDITYRVYDFERKDAEGKERELHTDLALEAINYNKVETQKIYSTIENESNKVVDCPFFTTNFIPLNGKMIFQKNENYFRVYMCVDGDFEIICNDVKSKYQKGDSILIPAAMGTFFMTGKASVLEIYIS
ncbi:type I phosphomannose isomerase catalytic subunit [Flavobacterium sp.]|uniref:type I phosphomannose isomerase catalytic subunit n=1 Tax=Flavobacterium sp. TaxID=239 RepID=UPI00286B6CA3|nr:type I phosphomannose isomerase catalytic subunit [Flavobacterium sp.]